MERSLALPKTALAALLALTLLPACSDDAAEYSAAPPAPSVPLAPGSPWPKFRGNAQQDGRSSTVPSSGGALWEFPTGKGIFSSPVIAADGTVFVGSADRTFYALAADGTVRWQKLTGEIIDSSALLDDQGRVYFGSGDGHLYALDAATGAEQWTFAADPPAVNSAFINWFEGNVAIAPDGTLYVPNDNWFVYAIDRTTSLPKWKLKMADQTWSSPAVDAVTGNLYCGNNNLLPAFGGNTFAVSASGERLWAKSSNGSVAASPLFTADGKVVVGGFDGFLRAYDAESGDLLWSFGTRDHLYSSPAQAADGTLIQPSADGTIYAIDPATGAKVWAFDTLEAIRSSPAIDANGTIYVGSGEGRLFALNSDGTLRWSMLLIADERNDVNASPALGKDAVYIAGENGHVFSVPYDYCLSAEASGDTRCNVAGGESLPASGAQLLYTTQLGAPLSTPPAELDANQTLAFSLFVRDQGDTVLALLDSPSLQVSVVPSVPLTVDVSGDRRFLTVVPEQGFAASVDGKVAVRVQGQYLVNPQRDGLHFTGGEPGGTFDHTFEFTLRAPEKQPYAMTVPAAPGDPASSWEIYRLAAPLPTILPSYNQIGFDSLHFLMGAVEGTPDHFIAWVAGAKLAEGENKTVIDPATGALFPLEIDYSGGLFTGAAQAGFAVEVMNLVLPLDRFRLVARLGSDGVTTETPRLLVSTKCAGIELYGQFLQKLGLCNGQTDLLSVFGAALLRKHESGVQSLPDGVGVPAFSFAGGKVTATLTGSTLKTSEHAIGLLLIDAATGKPLPLDYGIVTTRVTGGNGTVSSVSVPPDGYAGNLRAYLMVDTYPAGRGTVTVP